MAGRQVCLHVLRAYLAFFPFSSIRQNRTRNFGLINTTAQSDFLYQCGWWTFNIFFFCFLPATPSISIDWMFWFCFKRLGVMWQFWATAHHHHPVAIVHLFSFHIIFLCYRCSSNCHLPPSQSLVYGCERLLVPRRAALFASSFECHWERILVVGCWCLIKWNENIIIFTPCGLTMLQYCRSCIIEIWHSALIGNMSAYDVRCVLKN